MTLFNLHGFGHQIDTMFWRIYEFAPLLLGLDPVAGVSSYNTGSKHNGTEKIESNRLDRTKTWIMRYGEVGYNVDF